MSDLELLGTLRTIVGKRVRVEKDDYLDNICGIEDHLRWHIGDEFIVCKIEVLPYGCFLYNNKDQNLCFKRAKIID